jgi:GT2 family glycosyltransferase/ubiquinone biosynthesis protein Coq4
MKKWRFRLYPWRARPASCQLFDVDWYLEKNPDVAASGLEPLKHYTTHGWREGRSPHPLFDPKWYLKRNPDVASANVEPMEHYTTHGWREGRSPHPLFDSEWYLKENADVASSGTEPLGHYCAHGWREGRNPHPLFDVRWYVAQNPDVSRAGVEPLRHYVEHGWKEGRNPNSLFDGQWYLENNPHVAEEGREPLAHYAEIGWKENRNPHPIFNTRFFLGRNRAFANLGRSPLVEYQRLVESGHALEIHPGFTKAWVTEYLVQTSDNDLKPPGVPIAIPPVRIDEAKAFAALRPVISIGIILYHTTEAQLLRMVSILQQASKIAIGAGFANVQIVFTDNSHQWTEQAIRHIAEASGAPLHFVPTDRNVGFGRGHNHLMRHAFSVLEATHYFCLNPDGYLHHKALLALYRAIADHKLPALIEARQFPSEHPKDYDSETLETSWSSAGCLVIPKFLFELTGGFDDRFFMYCEDVDLSWRVWEAGYRCVLAPRARFLHHVASRERKPIADRQLLESGRILGEKWSVPRFRLVCERMLIERNHYESVEQMPVVSVPDKHLPHTHVNFSRMFGFSPFRW